MESNREICITLIFLSKESERKNAVENFCTFLFTYSVHETNPKETSDKTINGQQRLAKMRYKG